MLASVVVLLLQLSPVVRPALGQNAAQSAPASAPVSGIVLDETGGVIAGARVIARAATGGEQETVTGAEGRFVLAGFPDGRFDLIVRASGFAEYRLAIAPGGTRQDLEIRVVPATRTEEVTVATTRVEQRAGDVPATVNVINHIEIHQSPAVVVDDVLRQIPSFSLARRTSSLAAHPAAQGVSLRGIGSSGVSRTLVLMDGVPVNDAFGGWVYWSRIPLESIEHIEVVDGASSSLYGNYAMGGLISITTTPASRRTMELRAQYGNRQSPRIDLHASDVRGRLGMVVDVNAFTTDGYATVVRNERGPIDGASTADFKNVNIKLEYALSNRVRTFVRAGYFRERRDNGKVTTFDPVTAESNDTTWTSVSGGVRMRLSGRSEWQASVFTDREAFDSNNVVVPNPVQRNVGRLALTQTVPSTSWGGIAQWVKPFAGIHVLTAGGDWRWVEGESRDRIFDDLSGTVAVLDRVAGGTEHDVGAFVEDLITPVTRMVVTLSARVDHWKSEHGRTLETTVPDGTPTASSQPHLPARSDSIVSPRAAALYHFTDRVTAWGSVAAGYRAPTLNELYRSFRVGTTFTLANPDLAAERLRGGEVGVSLAPARGLTWRATLFDTRLHHPVSNVTVSQSGANVTLQRKNLGRTRTLGLQTDVEYLFGSAWRITGAYQYAHATVLEYQAPVIDPDDLSEDLVGKFLPQVAKHRGSVLVVYTRPRVIDLSVSLQVTGNQYDDDRNVRGVPGQPAPGLPGYAVLSFTASRPIDRTFELFVGMQNVLNHEYFVGTLPTLVGPPRMVNAGVRVSFRGR